MNIEVKTVNTVTLVLDESEARAILVDPSAFQDQLRTALADAHAANDHRKGQLALGDRGNGHRAKVERRPLGHTNGKRPYAKSEPATCRICGRTFKGAQALGPHMSRKHPTGAHAAAGASAG